MRPRQLVLAVCSWICSFAILPAGDWLMFGGNPQRTGAAADEAKITKENVRNLRVEWSVKLDNEPKQLSSLTVPVAIINLPTDKGFRDIVIVAGSSDTLFALNADNGKLLWSKRMAAEGTPKNPDGGWLCPNALNATPVIDRRNRTVYVIASDGKVHAFNVINGEDRIPPIPFVPPFAKVWSLTLVNDILVTTTSQGCNGVRSAVYMINLNDPAHPVSLAQAGPTGGAGIWGRAGAAITTDGLAVVETGDGPYDVAAGKYSDTFFGISVADGRIADFYTPANRAWITKKDLDMGNMSPVVFGYKGRELVAGAGKEGVIYLLDAKKLGGDDHRTPLYRTPLFTNEEVDFASRGFWGALAAAHNDGADVMLFAPAWGPQVVGSPKFPLSYGEAPEGSIMAFKVIDGTDGRPILAPAWRSRNMAVPEPPVIANGIVFAISSGEYTRQVDGAGRLYSSKFRAASAPGNAVLYAFDATTGKELFSSGKTMPSFTHFGGLAISEGRVYVVTYDSTLYAFSTTD